MSVRSELSVSEYRHRGDQMRVYMEEQGLAGLCIFGAMRIFYLSGFHHLATERPVVLVLPLEGDLALLVPHLEEENIPLRTPHIEEAVTLVSRGLRRLFGNGSDNAQGIH